MVIITLSECPASLVGDLSRWLFEVNVGVYVGKVSARVRDALWARIVENVQYGRVTMVYVVRNEQGFEFRTHNTQWQAIDFDGLKLMMRPAAEGLRNKQHQKLGFSNAAKHRKGQKIQKAKCRGGGELSDYVIIDLETTGFKPEDCEIIELAALRIVNGSVEDSFSQLVRGTHSIPPKVVELTGITSEMRCKDGIELHVALKAFLRFIGDATVVAHNAAFDYDFIRVACVQCGFSTLSNPYIDTLLLAKRRILGVENYKLYTLLEYLNYDFPQSLHRALADCHAVYFLYIKLFEN